MCKYFQAELIKLYNNWGKLIRVWYRQMREMQILSRMLEARFLPNKPNLSHQKFNHWTTYEKWFSTLARFRLFRLAKTFVFVYLASSIYLVIIVLICWASETFSWFTFSPTKKKEVRSKGRRVNPKVLNCKQALR